MLAFVQILHLKSFLVFDFDIFNILKNGSLESVLSIDRFGTYPCQLHHIPFDAGADPGFHLYKGVFGSLC